MSWGILTYPLLKKSFNLYVAFLITENSSSGIVSRSKISRNSFSVVFLSNRKVFPALSYCKTEHNSGGTEYCLSSPNAYGRTQSVTSAFLYVANDTLQCSLSQSPLTRKVIPMDEGLYCEAMPISSSRFSSAVSSDSRTPALFSDTDAISFSSAPSASECVSASSSPVATVSSLSCSVIFP